VFVFSCVSFKQTPWINLALFQDEDIIKVADLMAAAKQQADVDGLHFFAIPFAWFQRAWPILNYTGQNNSLPQQLLLNGNSSKGIDWKESIGKIENDKILFTSDESSQLQQQQRKPAFLDELRSKQQQQQQQGDNNYEVALHNKIIGGCSIPNNRSAAATLQHDKLLYVDYVLVGENVWTLLQKKFGYTGAEIRIRCAYDPNGPATGESSRIKILTQPPFYMSPSGRFPYEKYLNHSDQDGAPSRDDAATPAVVEDPAEDEFENDLVRFYIYLRELVTIVRRCSLTINFACVSHFAVSVTGQRSR
jgi:hypothetical protein